MIEFSCPHCSLRLRVADDAAGKTGRCPGCAALLRVPQDFPPESATACAPAAAVVPAADPPPPPAPDASHPPPDPAVESGGHADPLEALHSLPAIRDRQAASRTRPARPSTSAPARRKTAWAVALPLLSGSLLLAVAAVLYWNSLPQEGGTLSGMVLDEFEFPVATLRKTDLPDANSDAAARVLDDLAAHPCRLFTDLAEVTLRGSERGLDVELREGPKARIVRVDPAENRRLVEFLQQHVDRWEERRQAALAAGLQAFFADWRAQLDGAPLIDLQPYRDGVALPLLNSAVGFSLTAVAGRTAYRCFYEDVEGRLHFLLPPHVREFLLEVRTEFGTRLPGRFRVVIPPEE